MSNKSKGGYTVGYKKPPVHSRFKSGTSGNPNGRPKGAKSLSTILNQRLNKRLTIVENGRRKSITVRELIIAKMVNDAAAGDPVARREAFRLIVEEKSNESKITILYLDEVDRDC